MLKTGLFASCATNLWDFGSIKKYFEAFIVLDCLGNSIFSTIKTLLFLVFLKCIIAHFLLMLTLKYVGIINIGFCVYISEDILNKGLSTKLSVILIALFSIFDMLSPFSVYDNRFKIYF